MFLVSVFVTFVQWLLPGGLTAVWRYFRDQRPARKLLDPFTRREMLFVYSTVVMREYVARNDQIVVIQDERSVHREGVVSSYADVLGYFHIATLLNVAGIEAEKVDGKSCDEWREGDWEKNVIFLGSPISNSRTEDALRGCGYRFDEKVESIVREADSNTRWSADELFDYCIVAKQVDREGRWAHVLLAGLGPMGTQAGSHYIARRYQELVEQYSDGSFALLLKVDRRRGYTGWSEEDRIPK